MHLTEKVGAEGVASANGVDDVDLAARDIPAVFTLKDAHAVGSASDQNQCGLGPLDSNIIDLTLALIEPLDVFVARLDDVTESIDALNAGALFFGLKPESRTNVDVVRDRDALGCLSPLFDDEVAWLHGHGEAAKLNAVDAHLGQLSIRWQLVGSPTPVGCAFDIERVGRHTGLVERNDGEGRVVVGDD